MQGKAEGTDRLTPVKEDNATMRLPDRWTFRSIFAVCYRQKISQKTYRVYRDSPSLQKEENIASTYVLSDRGAPCR